jgi:hypothetical protein
MLKRRRGRPATGRGRQTGLRISDDLDAALDSWIEKQDNPKPSKPEAIRRLLRKGLNDDNE